MGVCCNIWSALGQVHGYFGTIRQLAITWLNVEQFPGAVCHMTPKQPLPIPGPKDSTNVATNRCMSSINYFQQNTQPQLFKHWSRKSPPKLLITMTWHCWVNHGWSPSRKCSSSSSWTSGWSSCGRALTWKAGRLCLWPCSHHHWRATSAWYSSTEGPWILNGIRLLSCEVVNDERQSHLIRFKQLKPLSQMALETGKHMTISDNFKKAGKRSLAVRKRLLTDHSQTTPSAPSHPLRHPRTGVSPTHLCLLAD